MTLEQVTTLLSSPTRVSDKTAEVELKDALGVVPIWRITRGLPLRDSSGQYLARARRLAADSVCRSVGNKIASIAELDQAGLVVFMTPYRQQLALLRYQLADPSFLRFGNGGFVVSKASKGFPDELTYFALIHRAGPPRWLAVTLRVPELFRGAIPPKAEDRTLITSIMLKTQRADGVFTLFHRTPPPHQGPTWLAKTVTLSYSVKLANLEIIVDGMSSLDTLYAAVLRAALRMIAATLLATCAVARLISRLIAMVEARDRQVGELERRSLGGINSLVHNMRNNVQSFRSLLYSPSTDVKDSVKNLLWQPLRQLGEKIDSLPIQILNLIWPEPASALYVENSVCLIHAVLHELEMRSYVKDRFTFEYMELEPNEYFGRISQSDISIILSHVLTNALESAAKGKQGKADPKVSIHLSRANNRIQIRVTDDGSGIAPRVLLHLFEDGISTKSTSGGRRRGSGLYTSRFLCGKWSATIDVERTSKTGTTMMMEFENVAPPAGIVSRITLRNCSKVVIVDDDDEIARYWEELIAKRLTERLPASHYPALQVVKSPEEFQDYIKSSGADETTYYLIDYQFSGSNITGLDLIEDHNLLDRAILVTNYSEDAQVLHLVRAQGVALLPKWSMPYLYFDVSIGEDAG